MTRIYPVSEMSNDPCDYCNHNNCKGCEHNEDC